MCSKAVPALMSLAGVCMAGWSLPRLIFTPREALCGSLLGCEGVLTLPASCSWELTVRAGESILLQCPEVLPTCVQ